MENEFEFLADSKRYNKKYSTMPTLVAFVTIVNAHFEKVQYCQRCSARGHGRTISIVTFALKYLRNIAMKLQGSKF